MGLLQTIGEKIVKTIAHGWDGANVQPLLTDTSGRLVNKGVELLRANVGIFGIGSAALLAASAGVTPKISYAIFNPYAGARVGVKVGVDSLIPLQFFPANNVIQMNFPDPIVGVENTSVKITSIVSGTSKVAIGYYK